MLGMLNVGTGSFDMRFSQDLLCMRLGADSAFGGPSSMKTHATLAAKTVLRHVWVGTRARKN